MNHPFSFSECGDTVLINTVNPAGNCKYSISPCLKEKFASLYSQNRAKCWRGTVKRGRVCVWWRKKASTPHSWWNITLQIRTNPPFHRSVNDYEPHTRCWGTFPSQKQTQKSKTGSYLSPADNFPELEAKCREAVLGGDWWSSQPVGKLEKHIKVCLSLRHG